VHALNENLASVIHLKYALIIIIIKYALCISMFSLEKVTFFAGKDMGFPRFFSKSFLQNCQKITTKEMADTNHGPN
jgi:hypothetical protein